MEGKSDRDTGGSRSSHRGGRSASKRSRRQPAVALAVVVLVVAGAAAWYLMRADRSQGPEPAPEPQPAPSIQAATAALSRGDFQAALDEARPLTQADPRDVEAHRVAGTALVGLGEYKEGLAELLEVVAARPGDAMTVAMIGTAHDALGELKEAESWYLKALQIDSKHAYTVARLADLYQRMNEPEKAAPYIRNATVPAGAPPPAPDDPKARSRFLAIQAELNFRAKKFAEAGKDLDAAIALTPREPELHFNLARVYEELGDVPKAILNYEKETEISPSHFGAYLNLGQLQLQTGRGIEAAASFQQLLKLRPEDPRLELLLAESYNMMNAHLDEALRLATKGLSKMPNNKRALELQAELRRKLGR